MFAVRGHPKQRAAFGRQRSAQREEVFDRAGNDHAAMGQQPVVSQGDAPTRRNVMENDKRHDGRPTKKPQGGDRTEVHQRHPTGGHPIDAVGILIAQSESRRRPFQSLPAFFCLTFRIVALEGDLAMHPPATTSPGPGTDPTVPPLMVVVRADDQGGLQTVEMNGRKLAGFEQLHQELFALFGSDPDLAAQAEARLDCDEHLAYQHTIAAVTALTGHRLPSGEIQQLVGKVRFVR